MKNKTKKATTELVWIDIAKTKTPGDAIAYGFVSPDLIPLLNQLASASGHSVVIGGFRFDNASTQVLSLSTTKWEEQS